MKYLVLCIFFTLQYSVYRDILLQTKNVFFFKALISAVHFEHWFSWKWSSNKSYVDFSCMYNVL